jgi:hypothetical protein
MKAHKAVGGLPLLQWTDMMMEQQWTRNVEIFQTQYCTEDYRALCIKGVDHLEYNLSSSAFRIPKLINNYI